MYYRTLPGMLTQLTSFATVGLHSERITVEVGATRGEGKLTIEFDDGVEVG